MTWTLWRGDTLLGHALMESLASRTTNSRPTPLLEYSSYLIPAPGAVLEGLMQSRLPVLDEDRFYQNSIPPAITSWDEDVLTSASSSPFAVLQEMEAEDAAGVPPDLQLRVVDDAGAQLNPRFITLHEARYEPEIFALIQAGDLDDSMVPIPADAYVNGSVWQFFAVMEPRGQTTL